MCVPLPVFLQHLREDSNATELEVSGVGAMALLPGSIGLGELEDDGCELEGHDDDKQGDKTHSLCKPCRGGEGLIRRRATRTMRTTSSVMIHTACVVAHGEEGRKREGAGVCSSPRCGAGRCVRGQQTPEPNTTTQRQIQMSGQLPKAVYWRTMQS